MDPQANPAVTTTGESPAAAMSATDSTTTPVANGNASQTIQNAKDTVVNTAQQAYNSVANSAPVQQLANGPVAANVKDQAAKTSDEFQNLANSRVKPDEKTATGQELTQYHSLFFNLLSWENPRATGLAFAASIIFILMARYLDVLHYLFKFAYFILGVTATLEIAGKLVFDDGIASKMRPRKYWTVPREALHNSVEDVEQLVNFFVIEAQRILYAENVYATITVFVAAFVSYYLIKIVPFWGLSLIGTSVVFLTPLVYVNNREAIDSSLNHVSHVVSSQATQIKDVTVQHTAKATESVKSYAGEYASKAQEVIGQTKASVTGNNPTSTSTSTPSTINANSMPQVPRQDPAVKLPGEPEQEPLLS